MTTTWGRGGMNSAQEHLQGYDKLGNPLAALAHALNHSA